MMTRETAGDGDNADPVHNVNEDWWTPRTDTRPPEIPRRELGATSYLSRPRLSPKRAAAAVAGAALITTAAVALWQLWPESGSSPAARPPNLGDDADVQRLRELLPDGYSHDDCQAAPPGPNVLAELTCGPGAEPSGPASGRFMRVSPDVSLDAVARSTLGGARIVACPGNGESYQSPGPWRRNAEPGKVAGTLICATTQGKGIVAWTTEASNLVSVVSSSESGPPLSQLYAWWSAHS